MSKPERNWKPEFNAAQADWAKERKFTEESYPYHHGENFTISLSFLYVFPGRQI
jgi:hypothetical protein